MEESIYLVQAIKKLRPTAEFSFIDNDYSTIKWDVLFGEAPTQEEIDAAIAIVKEEEITAKIELANKKAAAESKLAALGLTAEDLKALGLA